MARLTEPRSTLSAAFFTITIDLPESDMDARYRHLSHDRALPLLERARIEFLEAIGFPLPRCIELGLLPVVTSVSARYRREITAGTVTVTCDQHQLHGREFLMSQTIYNAQGKPCVTAQIGWLFMDGKTRRATLPPDGFVAAAAADGPRG